MRSIRTLELITIRNQLGCFDSMDRPSLMAHFIVLGQSTGPPKPPADWAEPNPLAPFGNGATQLDSD